MNNQEEYPSNAPHECPGVNSSDAGKSSSCQGCPNQGICSSGQASSGVRDDPSIPQITLRMSTVRRKIAILSGKGGVGKSTVTCAIARGLARRFPQKQIAVLDIDLCGPSMPTLFGCLGHSVHQSASGWQPIFVEENLCLMSVAFLLSSLDEAVVWRGPRKTGLIKQFLRDVEWGEIDYMLIDCPPGTSDEHLSIVQFLRACGGIDGALVVTTPQPLALADVRKEINFCVKVKLPILGVVENMSEFICGHCHLPSQIFPTLQASGATAEDLVELCKEAVVLARLPLDPQITRLCDQGQCIYSFLQKKESPSGGSGDSSDNVVMSKFLIVLEELLDKLVLKLD